ncbi:MAG: hypothetical protein AAF081_07580 [Actinomycetota bacterium]
MSTHDDDPWAPRADASTPSQPSAGSPIPDAPSAWAPPGSSSAVPPSRPPTPVDRPPGAEVHAEPPADRIVVDAVEADRSGVGPTLGRIVAAVAAVVLVAGGTVLAFGALTADGGAESPEAALEQAIAAINDEDIVALAAIMEPSERSTLFEVGFDFVDELVRLDVLDAEIDLAGVDGIDLELTGFEPRVERPGNGLAHLYLGSGVVAGEIDVAAMPLGALVLDRLDADQRSMTETDLETVDPATTPLVAVERDGRWYLSLWYTVAESVRLDIRSPLPDPFDRPAAIGGDTPEGPVRLLFEELADLDVRRMIGALDPGEMAVLYDYAPLFLGDLEPETNALLEDAAASGWTWGFDELTFATEPIGDDLAAVSIESLAFVASSDAGSSVSVALSSSAVAIDAVVVDEFFGDTAELSIHTEGECLVVEVADAVDSQVERICDDELGGLSATEGLESIDQFGFVTRQVDGVWYISPIRTGLSAMLTAVEALDPATLEDLVDSVLALGASAADGDAIGPLFDLDGTLTDPGSAFEPIEPIEPQISLANDDLLAPALDPTFAFDLDPVTGQTEIDFWAPELGELDLVRGVYATVASPSLGPGDVVVVSVELADLQAVDAITAFADATGATAESTAVGDTVVNWVDPFGDPIVVQGRGSRLHVFGVYGASNDDLQTVAAIQTAG